MKPILTVIVLCVFSFQLQAQVSFTLSSSPGVGNHPWTVVAADMNGDGKVDLISVNSADNTLSVLTNNGSGGFVTSGTYAVGANPFTVVAADANGDGKVDLISANFNGNTLSVLTNDGSGGFVISGTYAVGGNPWTVVAADVNGDGKVDLISANHNDNTLSVLTNNGSGGFVLASTLGVGGRPVGLVAADVNGDGKVDLISVNSGDNTLSVLTNNGSGGFVLASTPGVGGNPSGIVAADVNGDGKVDLICPNFGGGGGNTLSVLTNNGSGGFVLASSPSIGGAAYSIVAADVNGDGKVDLISANYNNNTLSVLTNDGSGGFVLAASPAVGSSPSCVVAADVNGDGKMDLISVNSGDNTLSVLINTTPFTPPPVPPVITTQPTGQTNLVGTTAIFSVGATNALSYQWQLDGTNLPAATNSVLILTNLTLSQAGNYDAVVANSCCSVTSSPAILDVRFILVSVNGQPAAGTMTAVASAEVAISGGYPGGFIFYTLDGSTPTVASTLYIGPFPVTNSALVQAMSLSADFSQYSFAAPVTLQIIPGFSLQTSVVGGGTVSANPTNGPYASNSVVTLTATPAPNWAFGYWTGDVTGTLNPVSVTMNGPLSVQAVFIPTALPLTASTPGGGSVTANGQVIAPATYYPTGSVVILAAAANSGWSFLGWLGDASGTNNPLSVTMNQTNDIQAIFGTVVSTNAVGGGSIVLNQPNPIPFGTMLTASAVPNSGNYFVIWSGAANGTNAPTTILVTNANPTINALFTSLPGGKYSLAVVVMGNGSVAISPQQNYYNSGANVTLNAATTNSGTTFYGWTGDAAGTNDPLVVGMNTSKVIQANFGTQLTVSISPENLIILAGSNGVLNADATGLPPLSYQWQNSQGPIAGATNAIFTIFNAQQTDADNYTVVVSNPFESVTSAVATVAVVFAPSISLEPTNQTVAAGTVVTLSVSAGGTSPLNYQWFDNLGAIPDATNASFTLNPAQTNNWDNYFVVVSNAYGVVTSTAATLVVYEPVTIIAQPMSQIVPFGASVSFGIIASGFPAPTYQWALNGTNLVFGTSNPLTINQVGLANLGIYQVQVSNGYSATNSDIATLNMSPSLTVPFSGATTIWGQSATLSVGAVGSGALSYQWYMNGMAIDGATSATLNFTSIQFTNGGLYSVVVSSPFGVVTNEAGQVVVSTAGVSLGFCPALTINGVVGYSYIIQSTPNLTDTNTWSTLTTLTLTQPVQLWVDTNVDASSPFNPVYFYRVLPGQ